METPLDSSQPVETPQDSPQTAQRTMRRGGMRAAVLLPDDHAERRKRTKLVETIAGRPPELTDELSKYAFDNADFYRAHGWEALIKHRRGRSSLHPDVRQLPHKAARYLDNMRRRGAPVLLHTKPWTLAQKDAAIARGPHPSANEHEPFLRQEMLEMCQRHQWMVIPYSLVRHEPTLRISPPGVIPQRNRRPRTIVDYTFSSVNADTAPIAPNEAMQFGKALHRILQTIFFADKRWGPVHLMKGDISDGFYQAWLLWQDILKLAVVMPRRNGEEPLIALPFGFPMGWVNAPPFFCSLTETAADLANNAILRNVPQQPHRHDTLADTPTQPALPLVQAVVPPANQQVSRTRPKGPVASTEVYMDDFMGLAQGGKRRRQRIRRAIFHGIDSIFCPPDDLDDPDRKDPISEKKLRQGDGCWETSKIILGWHVDTVTETISLPPHRAARLHTLLALFPRSRRRASITTWHKLLGELRSMILAIPGGRGMFSFLQAALPRQGGSRVRLTKHVHDQLDDLRWMAQQLTERPTRLAEIIPMEAQYVGTCDAAGAGMGGVWLPDSGDLTTVPARNLVGALPHRRLRPVAAHPPILWRHQFPQHIRDNLVSSTNPSGAITNSDLELAGRIAHQDILAQAVDLTETNTATGTDNTPTQAWSTKGSTTTTRAAAYLLRLAALHQRFYRYQGHTFWLPGPRNGMADDCSRLWNLTDTQLLAYFNSQYPQEESWQMHHLRPEMSSALISSLQCKRQPPQETFHGLSPVTTCGVSGVPSALPTTLMTCLQPSRTLSPSSKPLHDDTATDVLQHFTTRSELEQWKTSFVALAARSSNWGPKTLA